MNQAEKFMKLALKLAEKGQPSPNPYVGAVIVKDNKIIGRGFHKKAGMPHAEIEALNSLPSKEDARGATMYVTLEPCNHFGRTPPCTQALVEAGLGKVVFAMEDSNPKVAGGGEEELKKNNIVVEKGVLEEEAKKLNEVFVKFASTGLPFVVLKAAMTLDGKTATASGDSKWVTGEKARKFVHKMRSKYDAVLVGTGTALADDPQLTSRIRGGRDPLRIILDSELKIPLNAGVLKDNNFLIATTEKSSAEKARELEEKGGKVIVVGKEKVDLRELLKKLGKMAVTSVMVEGGGEVHGSFVDERLFDKIVFSLAPKIIGGKNAKTVVAGRGVEKISEAIQLKSLAVKRVGEDFLFEGYPEFSGVVA